MGALRYEPHADDAVASASVADAAGLSFIHWAMELAGATTSFRFPTFIAPLHRHRLSPRISRQPLWPFCPLAQHCVHPQTHPTLALLLLLLT